MAIERKALIFNIQKYNVHDGPGIRTLVFFKGCPLRCLWCSNPESQARGHQVLFKRDRCVHCGECVKVCPAGVHVMENAVHRVRRDIPCAGCRKCESACLRGALGIVGEQRTIEDILEVIEEDRPFYQQSGGGVTLGGGEALMQPDAALSLLMACRRRGLSTAVETCGYTTPEVMRRVAPEVDLFLYDIKHMDSKTHFRLTGVPNETILDNLTWLLENGRNVRIRVPLLKGVNDTAENLERMFDFLSPWKEHRNFQGVDFLPYHRLGVNKYAQLDREYAIPDKPLAGSTAGSTDSPIPGSPVLTEEDLRRVELFAAERDFPVAMVRH